MRSAHSEELSLLARERDAGTARLEDAEGEAELLKERIRDADKENEVCERVSEKRREISGLRGDEVSTYSTFRRAAEIWRECGQNLRTLPYCLLTPLCR